MDSSWRRLPGLPIGSSGRQATTDILNIIPWGVLLLDAAGGVLHANMRASALLKQGDVLVLERNMPRSVSSSHSEQLADLIGRACGNRLAGALALPRASGARPLLAEVIPLKQSGPSFLGRRPAAALFVSDPEWRPSICPSRLEVLFGLTQRQAELTAQLAEGDGLERAAARIGVSRHTAQTHLRRVLEKTGTHRQAELVRLVLCSPAILQWSEG